MPVIRVRRASVLRSSSRSAAASIAPLKVSAPRESIRPIRSEPMWTINPRSSGVSQTSTLRFPNWPRVPDMSSVKRGSASASSSTATLDRRFVLVVLEPTVNEQRREPAPFQRYCALASVGQPNREGLEYRPSLFTQPLVHGLANPHGWVHTYTVKRHGLIFPQPICIALRARACCTQASSAALRLRRLFTPPCSWLLAR
jgi:hypothetical protein